MKKKMAQSFKRLYSIIKKLRSPKGCAWDREQTPATMAPNLLEETMECIDAIRQKNDENLKEELGDMFLLVTMIGYMMQQKKVFTLQDSLDGICEKLIRRHPHVFADGKAKTSKEIIHQWEVIKRTKENKTKDSSVLDSVPSAVSPFEHAFYLQKKASKFGFDWEKKELVYDKVMEEVSELKEVYEEADNGTPSEEKRRNIEMEFGDVLFSVINLARFLGINPIVALHGVNKKFETRFRYMEKKMKEEELPLTKDNMERMDYYWNQAKTLESYTARAEK